MRDDGATALVHKAYNSGWLSGWNQAVAGVGLQGTPAAVSAVFNRVDVVMNKQSQIIHGFYDGSNGTWSFWETLAFGMPFSPGIGSQQPGHLEWFSFDGDGRLVHQIASGTRWGSVLPVDGARHATSLTPAVASRGPQNLDVITLGAQVNIPFHYAFNNGSLTLRQLAGLAPFTDASLVWFQP
jgi:hypothetical protein